MHTTTSDLPRNYFQNFLTGVWKIVCKSVQVLIPQFLRTQKNNFSQPLLSNEEILDLRLRVNIKQKQDNHLFDTAEQRAGEVRSIHRGYGLDYDESRHYQAGDEPRYINWKLTARTGELYTKIFREEHRPGIVILLDRRKTMLFGTRTRLKVTQAARVATYIAFSAQLRHASLNAIVLEVAHAKPTVIKQANDKQPTDNVIRVACAPCSPINMLHEASTQSIHDECNSNFNSGLNFGNALRTLHETISLGSTIYLIGDFIDLNEDHRSELMRLSAQNDVRAIHIFDPAESELPPIGTLRFISPENRDDMSINTMNPTIQKSYKDSAEEHFNARKDFFSSLNINYTKVSTNDGAIEAKLSIS